MEGEKASEAAKRIIGQMQAKIQRKMCPIPRCTKRLKSARPGIKVTVRHPGYFAIDRAPKITDKAPVSVLVCPKHGRINMNFVPRQDIAIKSFKWWMPEFLRGDGR